MRAVAPRLPWTIVFYLLLMIFAFSDLTWGVRGVEGGKQSDLPVSIVFRGGNIDDNIVNFYNYLYQLGRLPTARLAVQEGESLETALIRERVLFKYYPLSFDELLVRLNRENPDVTIRQYTSENGTVNEVVVYRPYSWIITPDVGFSEYRYLIRVELNGRFLADVVHEMNLLRYYDEQGVNALPLEDDDQKKNEILRVNPSLRKEHKRLAGISKISDGEVLFPAEGFTAIVYLTEVEIATLQARIDPMALLNRNVLLGVFEVKLQTTSNRADRPAATTADLSQDVNDPLGEEFTDHLTAINYYYPEELNAKDLDRYPVVIIDAFPLDLRLPEVHQLYCEAVERYWTDDFEIDSNDERKLQELGGQLKLSPGDAKMLEDMVKRGDRLTVDLDNHYEFHEKEVGVVAAVIDSSLIKQELDHGLHVAGIIAARRNGYGMCGVYPSADLVAYDLQSRRKYYQPGPSGVLTYVMERFLEKLPDGLVTIPVIVINASWTQDLDYNFQMTLREFEEGVLVVAAAGDGIIRLPSGKEIGGPLQAGCGYAPACWGMESNIIAVTSFYSQDPSCLHPAANYTGEGRSIDMVPLAAPGFEVLSSIRGTSFATLSGTSQAAGFVTAAAAMLRDLVPDLSAWQIKKRLLYTADVKTNYADFHTKEGKVGFGKLNVERALRNPWEDQVFVGGPHPQRGLLYYYHDGSPNYKKQLDLYREGKAHNRTTVQSIWDIRRVAREEKGRFFTVVYEHKDNKQLMVERNVSFLPLGREDADGRLDYFDLLVCLDDGFSAASERSLLGLMRACQTPEVIPIDLKDITDLLVRARSGRR